MLVSLTHFSYMVFRDLVRGLVNRCHEVRRWKLVTNSDSRSSRRLNILFKIELRLKQKLLVRRVKVDDILSSSRQFIVRPYLPLVLDYHLLLLVSKSKVFLQKVVVHSFQFQVLFFSRLLRRISGGWILIVLGLVRSEGVGYTRLLWMMCRIRNLPWKRSRLIAHN